MYVFVEVGGQWKRTGTERINKKECCMKEGIMIKKYNNP